MSKYFTHQQFPDLTNCEYANDYHPMLDVFYLNDNEDLSMFIKDFYKGSLDYIKLIPIRKWFIYYVDDFSDSVNDRFELLVDFKKDLLNKILNASELYRIIDNFNLLGK